MIDFGTISQHQFLAEYWQKKPILIKGGFKNFIDPLDADELAGLASEDNIESRLIYYKASQWQAESGPFEDYSQFGECDWTLVVQAVNHWSSSVQQFTQAFHFIPQWRFDDVMVSFAATGGGVGPHVDNYDVFICQGSGNRHWRVGDKNSSTEVISHQRLLHVEPFEAIIDAVVSAGDILYIPPGYPHEGVSLDASMSFSVGYKSTNENELVSGFADYLLDNENTPKLLTDDGQASPHYGLLSNANFERISAFLLESFAEPRLSQFLGAYYSESSHELDLASSDYTMSEWWTLFKAQPLIRLSGLKAIYLEKNIGEGYIYVNGKQSYLPNVCPKSIQRLCNQPQINFKDIEKDLQYPEWCDFLLDCTNRGYWYFDEETP